MSEDKVVQYQVPSHQRLGSSAETVQTRASSETARLLDYSDPEAETSAWRNSEPERVSATPDEPKIRSEFERKTELVTDQIDRLGFASYQWKLFFVCGSGWLLDLLWAHAFGLAMPAIQQELGFSETQYGYLSTGFSLGMTLGALTWGILVDIVGRRAAFNYTVAISSCFGLCIGFANSYALLIFLATGIGFGVGGNIPVDTTIFLEFIPRRNRAMLVVMSIFQPIGSIMSTLIAWAVIPPFSCPERLESCNTRRDPSESCCSSDMNNGWRYMFYAISGITLFVFGIRFLCFSMLESPAFLLSQQRNEHVIQVLTRLAEQSGQKCTLTIDELQDIDRSGLTEADHDRVEHGIAAVVIKKMSRIDGSHLALLFKSHVVIRLTILTWLIYATDFWAFTLAGVFLPKILLEKGAIEHTSVTDTYFLYIIIACTGIPGSLIAMLVIRRGVRSKLAMIVSSAMMAASLFLFATINSKAGNLVFNCIEYFCQTIFNAILYACTPEAFESPVRGSASGIASFWGRLISIVAPLIGSIIYASDGGSIKVLFVAGGGMLVSTLSVALLPRA